ncbi:23S rRNA (adenine(2503)-C(2))-methyltransferase RlmN [Candidatus Sumerlaeota bacterium]|nr:23S rRNA (adenine(2503)-C(2))-methyltransferase RlmN [Candidatus Sumerlaeota bacterium]
MAPRTAHPIPLVGQTVAELEQLMIAHGEKPFHGRQLAKWIYQRGARDFEGMTDLSKGLRAKITQGHRVGVLEVAKVERARDETCKILFRLPDGGGIEGVLMRQDHRWSLCVSSQAGCALRCQFCVTGRLGLARQLTPGEIVDQVILAKRLLDEAHPGTELTNLVFMGMGEPLLNLDNVTAALGLLISPQCVAMSPRRITVSTAGVTPGIRQFGQRDLGVNLALSLNATTQALREILMPHAKRWPLDELLETLREFPMATRRRLTLEYVLLADVNDSPADARRLAKIAHGLRCKINLLPFNEAPQLAFDRPSPKAVEKFQSILLAEGLTVSVRHSKGRSISAACGQLAGEVRSAA